MLDTLILTPGIPEAGTETLKPEIRVIESEDTYGKVAVEPLPRGFGLTIVRSSRQDAARRHRRRSRVRWGYFNF